MNDAKNMLPHLDSVADDYEELAIESAHELDELVRLRAELSWADWKAHPRFKRDRLIREAQRRMGVPDAEVPMLPAVTPANDTSSARDEIEAMLSADECFATVCDERRDAWIDAIDADEHED